MVASSDNVNLFVVDFDEFVRAKFFGDPNIVYSAVAVFV
jgi:hypothetical protein